MEIINMFVDTIKNLALESGFAGIDFKTLIMFIISGVLIYLAIGRQFEPLLLLPIAALLLWLAPDSVWLSFLIAEAITCVATLLLYRRTVRPLIAALADSDSSR